MNRGPVAGRAAVDHLTRTTLAWHGSPPDWVVVLAEECNKGSQSAVAKRLDYSPATISQILSNSYRGDVSRVEQMVRGALMAETIACPALGDLARNTCLSWQAKPYAATSSHRVQMYRACRSGCPHSRISTSRNEDDDAL
ncbi:helix-turn-helix transcriptional regulator (plasmid) [Rhizobium lusitanum]|uniref:helix-turn-helix domain-containing protein n=1 Tax=Rhizobium lusitanum TaxID=293958 RepID=UPI00160C5906|nr:helix-turn-helix transcriptional regulator [Rhizobium lusitanum]QND45333.1 helix-turn-helix transcriptional regulator [Rhizobium lusitanum]